MADIIRQVRYISRMFLRIDENVQYEKIVNCFTLLLQSLLHKTLEMTSIHINKYQGMLLLNPLTKIINI